MRRHWMWRLMVVALVAIASTPAQGRSGQGASGGEAEVAAAIAKLGAFDFGERSAASRTLRRASASVAVPALTRAVKSSEDSYVQFRALVLLSSADEVAAADVMRAAMTSKNDRLRAVSYAWYEHHPSPTIVPLLIDALARETSEFVRPSLTRALAAQGERRASDALLPLVTTGENFFRAEVIQALGDYHVTSARDAVRHVASQEGPLQEDAIIALGKIGDASMLPFLAELQRTVSRERQPAIAAAICLLGVNCDVHRKYLSDTLAFAAGTAGFQPLLRSVTRALSALAGQGDQGALAALLREGTTTVEASRAPIALATGTAVVRRPTALLEVLRSTSTSEAALAVVRDAFDMLEEDFEEERFFAEVRRVFWASPEGSAERRIAQAVLQTLEF